MIELQGDVVRVWAEQSMLMGSPLFSVIARNAAICCTPQITA